MQARYTRCGVGCMQGRYTPVWCRARQPRRGPGKNHRTSASANKSANKTQFSQPTRCQCRYPCHSPSYTDSCKGKSHTRTPGPLLQPIDASALDRRPLCHGTKTHKPTHRCKRWMLCNICHCVVDLAASCDITATYLPTSVGNRLAVILARFFFPVVD